MSYNKCGHILTFNGRFYSSFITDGLPYLSFLHYLSSEKYFSTFLAPNADEWRVHRGDHAFVLSNYSTTIPPKVPAIKEDKTCVATSRRDSIQTHGAPENKSFVINLSFTSPL